MFLAVFDNFLDTALLEEVDKELLLIEWSKVFERANSYMLECNDIEKYPILKKMFQRYSSSSFLNFLENISNITGIISDPYMVGSGYSQIKDHGDLKPHIDFNWNDKLKLYRSLSFIIYLTTPENGGDIEFIDYAKIKVKRNRAVIFSHSEQIRHMVHPVTGTRNAIRFFYYTSNLQTPSNSHRSLYGIESGKPADVHGE